MIGYLLEGQTCASVLRCMSNASARVVACGSFCVAVHSRVRIPSINQSIKPPFQRRCVQPNISRPSRLTYSPRPLTSQLRRSLPPPGNDGNSDGRRIIGSPAESFCPR